MLASKPSAVCCRLIALGLLGAICSLLLTPGNAAAAEHGRAQPSARAVAPADNPSPRTAPEHSPSPRGAPAQDPPAGRTARLSGIARALEQFVDRHPGPWYATWDPSTGTLHRLYGGSVPVAPHALDNPESAAVAALAFVYGHADLLGVNPATLGPPQTRALGRHWLVRYGQVVDGVPVDQPGIQLLLRRDGRLTHLASSAVELEQVATQPALPAEAAVSIARAVAGAAPGWQSTVRLVLLPVTELSRARQTGEPTAGAGTAWTQTPIHSTRPPTTLPSLTVRLAHRVELHGTAPPGHRVVWIDAMSGEVLRQEDQLYSYRHDGCVSGTIVGGLYPEGPDEPQEAAPFADELVELPTTDCYTDTAGVYGACDQPPLVEATFHLRGRYVEVLNDDQPSAEHLATVAAPGTYDLDWRDVDVSSMQEESNVFYHINLIHDYFTRGEPFDVVEMNYRSRATVQFSNCHCNAYSNGYDELFCGSSSGCRAFSLGSDIIYHEYTHSVVHHVFPYLPYEGQTGAMNEGWADYFAATINGDPLIGEHVGSSFIRNLQNSLRFPQDFVGEAHHDSGPFSGAQWDLGEQIGRAAADTLVMRAMRLWPQSFDDTLADLLVVDDDDGDLANGTPHIEALCAAFYANHGIFCPACVGYLDVPVAHIAQPPAPPDHTNYGPGDTIVVVGTAAGSRHTDLRQFTITLRDESSGAVLLIGQGDTPVIDGELLEWPCSLTNDPGEKQLLLSVEDTAGRVIEYDVDIGLANLHGAAKTCETAPCVAGEDLIGSRDHITGAVEPNSPNTVDACEDGSWGMHLLDASLERVEIENLSRGPGHALRVGDRLRVSATAFCWSTPSTIQWSYLADEHRLLDPGAWLSFGNQHCTVHHAPESKHAEFTLEPPAGPQVLRSICGEGLDSDASCGRGHYDDNDDIVMIVLPADTPPTVDAGGPYVALAGVATHLDGATASDPEGQSLDWSWELGDGSTADLSAPFHVYAAPGSLTVVANVVNTAGGRADDTTCVEVGDLRVALPRRSFMRAAAPVAIPLGLVDPSPQPFSRIEIAVDADTRMLEIDGIDVSSSLLEGSVFETSRLPDGPHRERVVFSVVTPEPVAGCGSLGHLLIAAPSPAVAQPGGTFSADGRSIDPAKRLGLAVRLPTTPLLVASRDGRVMGGMAGDVNADDQLSAVDAALLLQAVVGSVTWPNPDYPRLRAEWGDLSGNEQMTAFDAALLLARILGEIHSFPVEEAPFCGGAPPSAVPGSSGAAGDAPAGGADRRTTVSRPRSSYVEDVQRAIRVEPAGNADWVVVMRGRVAGPIALRPATTGSRKRAAPASDSPIPIALALGVRSMELELTLASAGSAEPTSGRDVVAAWRRAGDHLQVALAASRPIRTGDELLRIHGDRPRRVAVRQVNEIAADRSSAAGSEGHGQPPSGSSAPRFTGLLSPIPNPFWSSTTIRFALAAPGWARLAVYDVSGRVVRVLTAGRSEGGQRRIVWDGTDTRGRRVASGIYFLRMETVDVTDVQRLVVLR